MKITISQNGSVIRVYHLPKDVIVKPKEKKVILYEDGVVCETYDLIERNLSWFEINENNSSEILLSLEVR
ncbi:MAG: hypothetical protein OEQ15_05890 [Nitrosopumilus sp.]|nr:hypothetical protein [Nitrosopumilus sp.]